MLRKGAKHVNDNEEPRENEKDESPHPVPVVISTHPRLSASSGSFTAKFLKSDLAMFTMAIAEFIAGLGCVGIIFGGAYVVLDAVTRNDPVTILASLIGTPIAFVLQLANFIVFAKVADLLRK